MPWLSNSSSDNGSTIALRPSVIHHLIAMSYEYAFWIELHDKNNDEVTSHAENTGKHLTKVTRLDYPQARQRWKVFIKILGVSSITIRSTVSNNKCWVKPLTVKRCFDVLICVRATWTSVQSTIFWRIYRLRNHKSIFFKLLSLDYDMHQNKIFHFVSVVFD